MLAGAWRDFSPQATGGAWSPSPLPEDTPAHRIGPAGKVWTGRPEHSSQAPVQQSPQHMHVRTHTHAHTNTHMLIHRHLGATHTHTQTQGDPLVAAGSADGRVGLLVLSVSRGSPGWFPVPSLPPAPRQGVWVALNTGRKQRRAVRDDLPVGLPRSCGGPEAPPELPGGPEPPFPA